MSVTYSDPTLVTACKITDTPPNRSVTGYGPKIPTRHMLKYGDSPQWRRVYIMCYSNSGTAYFLVKGERLVLDTDTEYKLSSL